MIYTFCPRCAIVRPVLLVTRGGTTHRCCTRCGHEWNGVARAPEPQVPDAFKRAFPGWSK